MTIVCPDDDVLGRVLCLFFSLTRSLSLFVLQYYNRIRWYCLCRLYKFLFMLYCDELSSSCNRTHYYQLHWERLLCERDI